MWKRLWTKKLGTENDIHDFFPYRLSIEALLSVFSEPYRARLKREEGMVFSEPYILSRKDLSAALAHQNRARLRGLSIVELYAEIFWI